MISQYRLHNETEDILIWVDEGSIRYDANVAHATAGRAWVIDRMDSSEPPTFMYGQATMHGGRWSPSITVSTTDPAKLTLANALIYDRMMKEIAAARRVGEWYTRTVKL